MRLIYHGGKPRDLIVTKASLPHAQTRYGLQHPAVEVLAQKFTPNDEWGEGNIIRGASVELNTVERKPNSSVATSSLQPDGQP